MSGDAYKYIRYNNSQETRWATVEEIKRNSTHIDLTAEDYNAAGIPLMSDGKEAYVDNADTHSLIFGATGSKKTRMFCMPMINMMIKAGESFIVTDPKGELYAQTSGLAKRRGYKTVVLNLRNIGKGDKWNPLSIPYDMWQEGHKDEAGMLLADLVSSFAAAFDHGVSNDRYWSEAAKELAMAGLYVLMESASSKEEVNMKSFAAISSQGNVDNIKNLVKMMRSDCLAAIHYQSTACLQANVTASGIIGTLFGMIGMFVINEKLAEMMADNTFDIRMFGREKTAVYIIVPDEKTTYHYIVTMFIKQAYEILIEEAQKEKGRMLPVRVNFVLDEFCNIPKIADMPSMISAARSRNMRCYLIVQSMHQLISRYGQDAETIKGNCDNWVFLTSKEIHLLKEISALCGNVTMPDGSRRCLISASELQRLDKAKGEALIMSCRQYPIITEMADISQYEMFGIYPPEPLKEHIFKGVSCFSMEDLLNLISKCEAAAPFPSEKHKRMLSYHIYKLELRRAEREFLASIEDDEDEEEETDIGFSDMVNTKKENANEAHKENTDAESEMLKKNAAKAKKEKERKEKKEIAASMAVQNTVKRIAELLGDAYAKSFFENYYALAVDEDDDFDLFDL